VPLAGLTAWQLLVDTAHAQAGQRVVINAAAGGVGHFAVQIAKHLGVHVTAIASKRHHAWLIDLGADDVVDYTALRFEDCITDADIFVDLVGPGMDDTSLRAVQVLRPGGLLIIVPSLGLDPELTRAAAARAVRTTNFVVEPDGAALTTIAHLIDNGDIHPELAAVLPLDEVGRAHTLGETNRTRGKIVLSVMGK
jgi:NADPH:quinone reductase-like Zn-dependent oxidoreductase